jgi:branched-chain amino acid transport system permease protein
MLGAFIAYTLCVILKLHFAATFLITLLAMFAIGYLTERIVIGPLLKRGSRVIHIVLATIGLSFFLQNFAMLRWGTEVYQFPSVFGDSPLEIGTVTLIPQDLCIVAAAVVCMLVLHIFMTKTRLGTAMRAASQDKIAAGVLGINVPLTNAMTWAMAAATAGMAGVLLAPIYGVYATMGALVGLKGFAAAVVGGYGNMYGAMVGGVLLGLVETFASAYISSDSKEIIVFAVLLIVLFFMPTGILKSTVIENA